MIEYLLWDNVRLQKKKPNQPTNQKKKKKKTKKASEQTPKHPDEISVGPQRESFSQFAFLSSLTYPVAKITSNLLNSKSFHSRTGFGWGLRALRLILGLIMLESLRT